MRRRSRRSTYHGRIRRRIAILTLAATSVGSVLFAFSTGSIASSTTTATPGLCAQDVVLIGGRGVNETLTDHGGLGSTVGAVWTLVSHSLGSRARFDALPYRDETIRQLVQQSFTGVLEGERILRDTVIAEIHAWQHAGCSVPLKILLAGYSKGAWVVGEGLASLRLSTHAAIAGVVLLGDPQFNHRAATPRPPQLLDGIAGPRSPYAPADLAGRVRSYCHRGDAICNSSRLNDARLAGCGLGFCPHFQYATPGPEANHAAAFLVSVVPALPPPPTATPTPTPTPTPNLPGLTVTTTSLPIGDVRGAYFFILQAADSSGQAGCTWTAPTAALPPGIALQTNGTLAGTPSQAGVFTVPVTATSTVSGASVSAVLTLTVLDRHVSLHDVHFVDPHHGWVVGYVNPCPPPPVIVNADCFSGLILSTSDGGASWTRDALPQDVANVVGVWFVDANRGWALGSPVAPSGGPVVLSTGDAGTTWVHNDLGGALSSLRAVDLVRFADPQHGWIFGRDGVCLCPTVLRTLDGGATWQVVSITTPDPAHFNYQIDTVAFGDALHGWAGGVICAATGHSCPSGFILATADGGVTWTAQTIDPAIGNIQSLSAVSASHAWAIMACSSCPQTEWPVFRTTNGGTSWTALPGSAPAGRVQFVDQNHGWTIEAGGDGLLVDATVDGGQSWIHTTMPLALSPPFSLVGGVSFVDRADGWVVGNTNAPDSGDPVILHTGDGGATWTRQTLPPGI